MLLHPLLSLTHWIFRSLVLPYKSSSHSAKCVRCAPLRSGGRRLAVRIVMGCQIGTLPRTPFASSRRSPQGETRGMREKTASHILHVPPRCFPLRWLAPPPFPRSSVGRQKESALMGRLGALLRPTWRSYAGPPQGHYKAPLCCELLMKGLLRGV